MVVQIMAHYEAEEVRDEKEGWEGEKGEQRG
jgi:hypothetical protein